MKNLLELEIDQAIRNVGFLLRQSKFQQAMKKSEEALEIFYQNVAINETIRKNYECHIMSLQGLLKRELGNQEEALNCFNNALNSCSNHNITLLRRCSLLLKMNKLEEAMQDLDKILLQFPQSKQINKLKDSIFEKIQALENQEEKIILTGVYNYMFQSQQHKEEFQCNFDQESRMNFAHLQQIDKQSVEKQYKRKSTKIYSLIIQEQKTQNHQNQCNVYASNKRTSSPVIIGKNKKKKRRRNASSSDQSSLNISQKFRSSQVNISQFKLFQYTKDEQNDKDSDSNLPKRQSLVKFSDSETQLYQKKQKIQKKRRSCLRISRMSSQSQKIDITQCCLEPTKGRYSFNQLKQIDTKFKGDNQCIQLNQDGSDEENQNQHHIFEQQFNQNTILQCLNNLNLNRQFADEKKDNQKKKSILRKNSSAVSVSSKKSVTFKIQ